MLKETITVKKIELNDQFLRAYNLMEHSDKHVFITGKAGTGKSTLLDYFRENTAKNAVVLAPTGVAAINVKGQTIHSFFRFKPDVTLSKIKRLYSEDKEKDSIYKKLDAIVIDEVSMVRADLMDCIDKFMRLNGKDRHSPFGGAQMIFIGDLYQLPPVLSHSERAVFQQNYEGAYFFYAQVFQSGSDSLYGADFEMEFIELEKIYRQEDQRFIDVLNAIRNNTVTDEELALLNQRFDPHFDHELDDYYIYLTTTNKKALEINERRLEKLTGESFYFKGRVKGDFDQKYLPTDIDLNLKVGAQIMLLNNDSGGRWVNGSIGRIMHIDQDDEEAIIWVELATGEEVEVAPHKWDVYSFEYDKDSRSLLSESIGSFTQYPLKLAWAITIHKSQGKTFDKVVIDTGNGIFAHGQMYVALSRCTSLEGLILKNEVRKRDVFMDWKVVEFVTKYQYGLAEKNLPLDRKIALIESVIAENGHLDITYLKAQDIKTKRTIQPLSVGKMEYMDTEFIGMSAYCHTRNEERVFRVDRILEMELAGLDSEK